MPMPHWWGQINKRLFNPRAVENGKWDVITHVGRVSGATYRTPLAATEAEGTFVFIVVYGSRSDWVQNILASGSATLETNGEVVELTSPRIIPAKEAVEMLDGRVTLPPRFLKVNEYLQMDVVSRSAAANENAFQKR
jgi:deazaflavin-dependent oxidoreductase (nitroreductase family)